jgi:hypothetical protein
MAGSVVRVPPCIALATIAKGGFMPFWNPDPTFYPSARMGMQAPAVHHPPDARHRGFGGALNLNVHFHCVIPDGVFVQEDGSVRFVELAPPSDDKVMAVLRRAVARLERLLCGLPPRLLIAPGSAPARERP